jgi:hypothetical protein
MLIWPGIRHCKQDAKEHAMRMTTFLGATRDGVFGALIGGALVLTAALAAEDTMMMTDADGDGLISYDEATIAYPTLSEVEFQALDDDGDGGLDTAEIAAAREAELMPDQG